MCVTAWTLLEKPLLRVADIYSFSDVSCILEMVSIHPNWHLMLTDGTSV